MKIIQIQWKNKTTFLLNKDKLVGIFSSDKVLANDPICETKTECACLISLLQIISSDLSKKLEKASEPWKKIKKKNKHKKIK